MSKGKLKSSVSIKNRKAEFEYFLLTKFTAGLALTGTEIKSIRSGKANIQDAYCSFVNGELWVHNMHVSEYAYGSYNNHEAKRDRKLLLNKPELKKLHIKLNERGFTIIPSLLFINEYGYAKLDVHLARGKKKFDKRENIKEKDNRLHNED